MADFAWTGEQARAIVALGHTMLEANAGTGKTTTVIGKILWHLGLDVGLNGETGEPIGLCPNERKLTLSQIAAITFTEKAAYDLKRKLRQKIEELAPELLWDIDRAAIGTIHSFSGEILREHALRFGIDPTFSVLDEREAKLEQELLARDVVLQALEDGDEDAIRLVQDHKLTGTTYGKGTLDYVLDMMRDIRWHRVRYDGWCGDDGLNIECLRELAQVWDEADDMPVNHCATLYRLAKTVAEAWEEFQRAENSRDFDALILDCRRLLTQENLSPALASIRRRLGLFIVDEFQDTDGAQRDIAFRIAGVDGGEGDEQGPQLFVVGDPKQSIYGFRGADIAVWNEVQAALRDHGEPLALTRNFRSEPAVVDYVNRVCAPLLDETGRAVKQHSPASRVNYVPLVAARAESEAAQVEWLVSRGRAEERRELEAAMVAARIRDIVVDPSRGDYEGTKIVDPDTGELRDCAYRDIAILFRSRTGITKYEAELQHYGAPYYLTGDAGLTERLEVLDILTLLRLIENPLDDLRAFAYLRSPFVGLRDEVIARIRLTVRGQSLLSQARQYLEDGEWYPAPEHPDVSTIEREALANGLQVIDDLTRLRSRVPIDRLVEEALDRTGYRLHLLLLEQPEPRLANLQRFIRILEGYRNQTVGTFLEIWARWEGQDLGIPQAPLYSKRDDVVTLSTIHAAKGLEWPVVFLVDNEHGVADRKGGTVWSDRVLGPILCPKQKERGPRSKLLAERAMVEERAEEARLIYVATTRARDRLVIAGALDKPKEVTQWLARGRDDSVRLTQIVPKVEIPPLPPEPSLEWLDGLSAGGALPSLTHPVPTRRIRFTQSATELMARGRSRQEWRLKYHHGVIPRWFFAPDGAGKGDGGGGLPATTRGVVIHGVLERIQEEEELAELLDVVIGALDAPELEEHMAPGSAYRRQLEEEIRAVVAGDDWRWYVEGEHYRELDFVQFRTPHKWRIGAFDLYRPGDPSGLIVDFKTQDVTPEEAERVARKYRSQAGMYRTVAGALGVPAEMRFHFTKPNAAVAG